MNTKEFISGLTWGAGLAVIASATLGLLVSSNTFPALTQFMQGISQKQKQAKVAAIDDPSFRHGANYVSGL